MKKLIVYINNTEGFVNIVADRIAVESPFLYAFNGDALVGIFDIGTITMAYLSEKKEA